MKTRHLDQHLKSSTKHKTLKMAKIGSLSVVLVSLTVLILLTVAYFSARRPRINAAVVISSGTDDDVPTGLSHIAFGLQGSEKTYHFRRHYLESWWIPGKTRGYVYLDREPGGDLIPWPKASPPYRVNDDISKLVAEVNPTNALMPRMVHGILELFREEHKGMRWLVMGDDDTVFFLDNLVHYLAGLDHRKPYYIGYPSEFVMSNHWFSFEQAFGGGGIILSRPLAEALVNDMDRCLRTYSNHSADLMTMKCIADLGVDLTRHKGVHQMDFRGDVSGFLSAHPKELVLSFHHIDAVEPYFPGKTRAESLRHLMKAADVDQSRLFQQTVCYDRNRNWSFSTSWGYSAHIYERIIPRNWLMKPLETFKAWAPAITQRPLYMLNTRKPYNDPCETPHVFYFESVRRKWNGQEVLSRYTKSANRNLTTCDLTGSQPADHISQIRVISPSAQRYEIGRSECCDIVGGDHQGKVEIRFRECRTGEVIG